MKDSKGALANQATGPGFGVSVVLTRGSAGLELARGTPGPAASATPSSAQSEMGRGGEEPGSSVQSLSHVRLFATP